MDVSDFLDHLVPILKARNYGDLERLVSECEKGCDPEVFYYLWLLFHPDAVPYIDDELNDAYAEIADLSRAEEYAGRYFAFVKESCERGNSSYMSRLAELYMEGCGCEIDEAAARLWLRKAEALNNGNSNF